jgi:DUF1680 family protein
MRLPLWICSPIALLAMALALAAPQPPAALSADGETVAVVSVLPTTSRNRYYVGNRPPLAPSPLFKLPIGAIEPKGWLLSQLQLMRDGMTGHLPELSTFLGSDSGWINPKAQRAGWEELPYWLKGFGDLGYLLRDPRIIATAEKWLTVAFASQQRDGYFGPPMNRTKNDLWPNMVMLFAAQSLHEATGDKRVLSFMTRYFRYQYSLPEDKLLPGSWQKLRGGDNLESVYWLYNRTGQPFLLQLGRRLFRRTANWAAPILTAERDKRREESSFYHGVNIAMGIRQPGVYYQQSKDPEHLAAVERNYRLVMQAYGQQPGGMFGADENIRPGEGDPRQGAETCSMVELMYSDESLLRITGDPRYAERTEEIAFNSLPAAMTPDLKALHYLTAPNLVSCDASGEHTFQNDGNLVSFTPLRFRCCQHNVAFGWPYFAEHLWMATADNGLAAVMHAPGSVSARVGDVAGGTLVTIAADTAYPFGEIIDYTVSLPRAVAFPLYLRVPAWSEGTQLAINGKKVPQRLRSGAYVAIRRTWRHGDQLRLTMPQRIELTTWKTMGNAVSVRRGPLWYALSIEERWRRYGGTDRWPEWELLPASDWRYGLVLDARRSAASITVTRRQPPAFQPFTPGAAPLVLRAKARLVPSWKAEGKMVGKVPASPVPAVGPVKDVTLIPMGCARLRIAVFPVAK